MPTRSSGDQVLVFRESKNGHDQATLNRNDIVYAIVAFIFGELAIFGSKMTGGFAEIESHCGAKPLDMCVSLFPIRAVGAKND